jgi:hypothetical protein
LEDENIQETVHDNLVCVDKYLWSHPNLLQKRLIFFTVDTDPGEWLGYVAVNPWVRLVEYAEEHNKKYPTRFKTDEEVGDHLSGLLFNHSGHKQPKMTDTINFLWFFNLASRYRDMRLTNEHLLFNFERMIKKGVPLQHLMFLGWEGPFGEFSKINGENDYVYKMLKQPSHNGFYKNTLNFQGPAAWCIFMYDTILSFNGRSCHSEDMIHPYVGLICHRIQWYKRGGSIPHNVKLKKKEITNCFYQMIRCEIQLATERLRYLFFNDLDVVYPTGWGKVMHAHQDLHSSKIYLDFAFPLLSHNQNWRLKRHPNYNKELLYQSQIMSSSHYEALTNTGHSFKSNAFVGHILRE